MLKTLPCADLLTSKLHQVLLKYIFVNQIHTTLEEVKNVTLNLWIKKKIGQGNHTVIKASIRFDIFFLAHIKMPSWQFQISWRISMQSISQTVEIELQFCISPALYEQDAILLFWCLNFWWASLSTAGKREFTTCTRVDYYSRQSIQWNPALRPPHWYDHLVNYYSHFILTGKKSLVSHFPI